MACQDNATVGVDDLPDELLVLVFSKLADGATLLDVLPLVCKRWCRLACDPASWAGVRIVVGDLEGHEARVLLHAPAAKTLEFGLTYSISDHFRMRALRSALRRSRVAVHGTISIPEETSVFLQEKYWGDPGISIANFLARQKDLRELRLFLWHIDEDRILLVIATLRRLHKLDLVTVQDLQYEDQLAEGLPELRELWLRSSPRPPRHYWYYQRSPTVGLLADLVRGARALRVLHTDVPHGWDLEACLELHGLQRLTLFSRSGTYYTHDQLDQLEHQLDQLVSEFASQMPDVDLQVLVVGLDRSGLA
ncbi:uncharacterized protein LOC117643161 [Thrips palmi]|uniref:Uncharacterized protein LOC117643161 n=1 Tax=Thrips palmi TaxID=161013 RepID=A0A6P8YL35_THRPL|nr:uncharacterized protein LOC117643161 [Thrips palmi]